MSFKTIVAGSRGITNQETVNKAILESGFGISAVICGLARGVDSCGEKFAKENNIPIEYFPADWEKYGRRAGFIRNSAMSEAAEALILVWDGKSPGSRMMLQIAQKKKLAIFEKVYDEHK